MDLKAADVCVNMGRLGCFVIFDFYAWAASIHINFPVFACSTETK